MENFSKHFSTLYVNHSPKNQIPPPPPLGERFPNRINGSPLKMYNLKKTKERDKALKWEEHKQIGIGTENNYIKNFAIRFSLMLDEEIQLKNR